MPKLKTKSGAKKRFKMTGTGKIKRKNAFKNHILTKKETKQKRGDKSEYEPFDRAGEGLGGPPPFIGGPNDILSL